MRDVQIIPYTSIKKILSGIVYNTLSFYDRYIEDSWFEEYDQRKKTFGASFTIREYTSNVRYELTFLPEDNQTAIMKLKKCKIGKNGIEKESEVLKQENFWIVFPSEGRKTNIYPCFIQKGKCINGSAEYYKYILAKQQKRKEKRQSGYQGFIDVLQETVLEGE